MSSRTKALTLTTVILLSLAACTSSSAQSGDITAKKVSAGSFELTDSEGAVRAALEMSEGSPQFVLLDSNNGSRLQIKIDEAGNPVLSLFDVNGSRRAGFEFANGENPALFLRDRDGTLKAGMQVQSDGAPLLFLRNSALEDGFVVTLINQDIPVLALADPQGNRRTFLGLAGDGYSGNLVFVGADGNVEAVVP